MVALVPEQSIRLSSCDLFINHGLLDQVRKATVLEHLPQILGLAGKGVGGALVGWARRTAAI